MEEKRFSLRDYAVAKLQFDLVNEQYKGAKVWIERALQGVKDALGYDAKKNKQQEEYEKAKQAVLASLEFGRNNMPGYGWIDKTEQPPTAVVIDIKLLLSTQNAYELVKSIELTEDAIMSLRSGGSIPGVELRGVQPSVRISVKEYVDSCKEQEGETNE